MMIYAKIKEVYLREGLIKDMHCTVSEKITETAFGSTDKKGYTVKISLMCIGEYSESYVFIEPWYEKDIVNSMIEKAVEESKYKFADLLLPKLI